MIYINNQIIVFGIIYYIAVRGYKGSRIFIMREYTTTVVIGNQPSEQGMFIDYSSAFQTVDIGLSQFCFCSFSHFISVPVSEDPLPSQP